MTPHIVKNFGTALEGSVVFGFSEVSTKFIEQYRAATHEAPQNLLAVALAYLHLRQLIQTVAYCPRGDSACEVTALANSPASDVIKFKRWENREAVLESRLREWRKGRLETVKVYE